MKYSSLSAVVIGLAALPSACSPTDRGSAPPLFDGGGLGGFGGSGGAGTGGGGGGAGGELGGDDGISCAPVDRRCKRSLSLPDNGESSIEIRGNFSPDGWSSGIPMTKDGAGSWVATVSVPWKMVVQYKFVIDGSTWTEDPKNPLKVDDGYGGWNSLLPGGTCDPHQCIQEPALRFAVIGDYGTAAYGGGYIDSEASVAALVSTFRPAFILTLGDNNYPNGLATTIDVNIGQFYHSYIHPYTGQYGPGATENRFFPCLGNHDWNSGTIKAYVNYFELPGNERYYDIGKGPVRIFCIDSEPQEPDGITADSVQAAWLKEVMMGAHEPFKLVIMHRPPYSSGLHGSAPELRWPFAEWGATAVMAGHEHSYERLSVDGIVYFVNGLGGASPYGYSSPKLPETQLRHTGGFGATLVEVSHDGTTMTFMTITTSGALIDNYAVKTPK
jgi:hypothetical protein